MRNTYLLALKMAINDLSKNEKKALRAQKDLADIMNGMDQFLAPSTAPDIDSIKRTKTFNVRLYAPLSHDIYQDHLRQSGFIETEEGELFVYTKITKNGIKVTIHMDTRGDSKNYKGEIFEYMGNPSVHMIAYTGHSRMGYALANAFDKAPPVGWSQGARQTVALLSCNSAAIYSERMVSHYPDNDFIGTKGDNTQW